MSEGTGRLARDSLVVGAATAVSRILGFVRDVMIARALGAGPAAEAFLVAFRLPNMLRRALGEGGLNAAVVPIYLDEKTRHGAAAARRFGRQAAAGLALLLMVLVGLVQLAAPWVVLVLAAGLADVPDTWALTTQAARLAFPFLLLTGLASLLAALLAAERRFTLAALAPLALNLALIVALLCGEGLPREELALWLAGAVSLGGAVHLALVWWAARRIGLAGLDFGALRAPSAALRRAVRLGLPAFLASAVAQFVMLAALQVASAEPGAVAWLHYADRVFQLPLGFVAVALGVVLLPEIARQPEDAAGHLARAHALDAALAFGLLLAIPAGAGLALLADPIIAALFERGAFGSADRAATALALAVLAVGLPGAVIARVLTQGWLAQRQPWPPLLIAVAALAAALVLASLLPLAAAGRAAAVATLAFWGQALGLMAMAWSQGLWRAGRPLARRLGLTLLATGGMAVALVGLRPLIEPYLGAGEIVRLGAVTGLCAAGLLAMAVLSWVLGLFKPLAHQQASPLASPRPPRA